jgi:preprotein translocase subunit Sss1
MVATQLITELSRNTKEVHLLEADKPYLQLSVYSIVTYADDYGYEEYSEILEIKGLDTMEMGTVGYEEALIKKEDCSESLQEILADRDLYDSFNTKAFLALMNGELSLKDYYLDDY